MNKKVLIINGIFYIIGVLNGYLVTANYYKSKLSKLTEKYTQSVYNARQSELKWKAQSEAIDKKYRDEINQINTSHSNTTKRLREQLSKVASRVSSNKNSSTIIDDPSRKEELSKRISGIINFSDRCARERDKLAQQVHGLQSWIKKENE